LELLYSINDPPVHRYYIPKTLWGFFMLAGAFPLYVLTAHVAASPFLIGGVALSALAWTLFFYYRILARRQMRLGNSAFVLVRATLWGVYLLTAIWVAIVLMNAT
jgi:hypothetical protein